MPSVDVDSANRAKINKQLADTLRPANTLGFDDSKIVKLLGKMIDQNSQRYDFDQKRHAREVNETEDYRLMVERELKKIEEDENKRADKNDSDKGGGLLSSLLGRRGKTIIAGRAPRRSARDTKKLHKSYEKALQQAEDPNLGAKHRAKARKRARELEDELADDDAGSGAGRASRGFAGVASKAGKYGALTAGAGIGGAGLYTAMQAANEKKSKASAGEVLGNVASGAVSGATTGASIGMMFGPQGALIGAGVGAVAGGVATLVTQYSDKIEQVLKAIGDAISSGMTAVENGVKNVVGGIASTISNIYSAITNGMANVGKFVYDNTIGRLPKGVQNVIGKGVETAKQGLAAATAPIKQGATTVYNAVASVFGKGVSATENTAQKGWEAAKTIASDAKATVAKNVTNTVGNAAAATASAIPDTQAAQTTVSKDATTAQKQISNLENKVKAGFSTVATKASDVAGGVASAAKNADKAMGSPVAQVVDQVKTGWAAGAPAQSSATPTAAANAPAMSSSTSTAREDDKSLPLGIRNNNPGNIMYVGQANSHQSKTSKFAVFDTMDAGLHEMARQIMRYYNKGINTVEGIISKWAPPNENNTKSYVQNVSSKLNVAPNAPLSMNASTLGTLMQSIGNVENGASKMAQNVSTAQIASAASSAVGGGSGSVSTAATPTASSGSSSSSPATGATSTASASAASSPDTNAVDGPSSWVEDLVKGSKAQLAALNDLVGLKKDQMADAKNDTASNNVAADSGFSWNDIPLFGGPNGLSKLVGG